MYAGLPIITNKITPEEAQGIPHHLLGNISLTSEPWTVGQFKKKAEGIIEEIRSRGRLPILVGGTHYYTQSLLFEDTLIGDGVEKEGDAGGDFLSREEIDSRFPILKGSTEEMLGMLRKVDPIMADRWHPKDTRRIQRSLEIFLTQGRKASDIYAEQRERKQAAGAQTSAKDGAAVSLPSTILFWVHTDPETLKTRLDSRIDKMLHNGLLDEVRSLSESEKSQLQLGHKIDKSSGIWVSIGFKEFSSYLSAGADENLNEKEKEKALALSIEQTKAATRQYAKRQVKWIRTKLITALNNADSLRSLYVVDSSDVSNFQEQAADLAVQVCRPFLEGAELPKADTICPLAETLLLPTREFESHTRPDKWVRKTCETCGTVAISEEQWGIHLKSRAHRARVKKADRPPRVRMGKAPVEPADMLNGTD